MLRTLRFAIRFIRFTVTACECCESRNEETEHSSPRLGWKAVKDSCVDASVECKQRHCHRASAIKQGVTAKRHPAIQAMEYLGQQR